MSKIPAILSATLSVSLAACGGGSDHTPIGQPMTLPVVTTPQAASAGTLTVFNSTDGLFITATAAEGWEYTETRLAVAKSLDCIPRTKGGKPDVNRFLLRRKAHPAASELSYNLPLLVEPGTELFISLYAVVREVVPKTAQDEHDCIEQEIQQAWAEGVVFPNSTTGRYFTFTVKDGSTTSLAGQYRTHAQAAWGEPMGEAATYLASNFGPAFANRVTLGSPTGLNVRFTSAAAVVAFLPQSGMPSALSGSATNPQNLGNEFAGNVLALALNVGFDVYDPAFSAGTIAFADLVVADPSSAWYGVPVRSLLAAAHDHLANRADPMGPTLMDTNDALQRVNANFENGGDLGFLGLP